MSKKVLKNAGRISLKLAESFVAGVAFIVAALILGAFYLVLMSA